MENVVALGQEEEMELAIGAFDFGAFYFALVVGVEQLHVALIQDVAVVLGYEFTSEGVELGNRDGDVLTAVFFVRGELEGFRVQLARGASGVEGEFGNLTEAAGSLERAGSGVKLHVLQIEIDLNEVLTRFETGEAIAAEVIGVD